MKRGLVLVMVVSLLIGCKSDSVKEGDNDEPLFTLLDADKTNINFQNTLTEGLNTNILVYEYFYNGGGVAAADFNSDGQTDLYFTANMSDNKLYINKGNMRFEDVTAASGAAGRPGPWKTGVNAVDINADGKMDIYVCYSGAMPAAKRTNQLFINTGNNSDGVPEFQEAAAAYGLASTGFSNQSYFLDYDKDGDLDMLLLNHNPKNLPILNEESTARLFATDDPEKGLRLFKQTNGHFDDVTTASGINGSELSYGLGLGIADFNEDGWPDFYVSNDYAVPDYYYINNTNGTFTNKLQDCIGHTSQSSMGNDVTDINNDALPDIFTLDMLPEDNHRQKLLLSPDNYGKFALNLRSGFYYQYMRNMLQINNGNGSFSETGQMANISNTDWSWAPLFADYDNDGWKDLYITNGYNRDYTNLDFINYMNQYVEQKGRLQREDVMDIIKEMPSSNVVNYLFKNNKDGSFENKGNAWGTNQPSNSNGAVYADLDNDGDLDLVVNNINQTAFVYRNDAQDLKNNNYLAIRLVGEGANTQGIGAQVKIIAAGIPQLQYENPTRGYLSCVSSILHFGLGNAKKADTLLVTWSSGKQQQLTNVNGNQVLEVFEKDAMLLNIKAAPITPFFTQVTSPLPWQAPDTSINDFNRQSLLISQLSYGGPCLEKYDVNKDGLDDIIVGGAAGVPTRLLVQQPNGTFQQKNIPVFEEDKAFTDGGIAVLDADGNGLPDIYICSGGYHNLAPNDALLQDRLYINKGNNTFLRSKSLPAMQGSKSCVRVQDINGDGAPDLFVGGRVVPGAYPTAPDSYILINDGKGNFTNQTASVCPGLLKAGMVTDAVWADLDNDASNELVIAGEWMPVTIFSNQHGKLVNTSNKFFSTPYSGWWNTISVADINGDNKPDVIAGNLGENTQFRATDKEPLQLYYGDFDGNGSIDPVFSFYIQHKSYPFITRDELAFQMPSFRKRFATFKSYADVSMENFFEHNELKEAAHLSASHMQTACFLSNATGKYTTAVLPAAAQYAPVNAITVFDYNNDGKKDLLLCGNNSHFKIRLGKMDANYGVLLQGDGKGNFTYIPQAASGFNLKGDVASAISISNTIYFGVNTRNILAYKLTAAKK